MCRIECPSMIRHDHPSRILTAGHIHITEGPKDHINARISHSGSRIQHKRTLVIIVPCFLKQDPGSARKQEWVILQSNTLPGRTPSSDMQGVRTQIEGLDRTPYGPKCNSSKP